MRKLFTIINDSVLARSTADSMLELLGDGYEISADDPAGADMVLVFGGDGAFLHGLWSWGFPEAPILGINTGHLGFFQELLPEDTDLFKQYCSGEGFTLQTYRLLKAHVISDTGELTELAIAANSSPPTRKTGHPLKMPHITLLASCRYLSPA